MEQRLLLGTDHDPLTGILHRHAFRERLESALGMATAEQPVSLLFLDLDRFKNLNDVHGHTTGDHVLRHIAHLLPTGDGVVSSRWSGEQFALLLPGLDESASLLYADRLRELISATPTPYHDQQIAATVSIGVSTAETPISVSDLFYQVGSALYAAKAAGRNRAAHFRALERDALQSGGDVRIQAFEAMQRVVNERAERFIAHRRRQLLDALQKQADRDGLTGLYNRGYLDRRIAHDHHEAGAASRPLCVALLDVDHFGAINKARGWPTGDETLRVVADLVRRNVRAGDWVARYGGEELAVVLPGASHEMALQVIERIRQAVSAHRFRDLSGGDDFAVTISAGVVQLAPGESLPSLWQRLSDRLREGKSAGRNRVCG
jgi:diguanylate cyclase (GGDEF)-like protein